MGGEKSHKLVLANLFLYQILDLPGFIKPVFKIE